MSTNDEKKEILKSVYTPTTPIKEENLFFGRKNHLDKIHEAVMQEGQHIILYGERGVGKTSLSNIVSNRYRLAITPSVTCNSCSTLHGIWKSIFAQLPVSVERRKTIGFIVAPKGESEIKKVTTMSDLLNNQQNSNIDEITKLLSILTNTGVQVLFVFDEFDQIENKTTIQGMSNIIKYCSDKVPNITVMVVGIGNSVNELIGEHKSIERCIKQVFLERMSQEELMEIVNNGNKTIGVNMPANTIRKIVRYSSGFPHFTHLLAKYTTLSALDRDSSNIDEKDFSIAIKTSLENVSESIRNAYQKAIITTRATSLFPQILAACALAPTDQHGTFRASDLEDVLSNKLKLPIKMQAYQYHIGKLCAKERGEILEKIEISSTRSRYRFSNPLFKGYILLKQYDESSSSS